LKSIAGPDPIGSAGLNAKAVRWLVERAREDARIKDAVIRKKLLTLQGKLHAPH
jgi:hypothetical protein